MPDESPDGMKYPAEPPQILRSQNILWAAPADLISNELTGPWREVVLVNPDDPAAQQWLLYRSHLFMRDNYAGPNQYWKFRLQKVTIKLEIVNFDTNPPRAD